MSTAENRASIASQNLLWEPGLLDAIRDGVVAIDSAGTIQHVNLAALRIFGYTPGELIGRSIVVLMPPEYRVRHDARFQNTQGVMQGPLATEGLTVEALRKDGSRIPVHITLSEIHTGERTYFTGVVEDLSEQILARKQLERQHERYEHAFRLTSDGIWDWDVKTRKFYYSDRTKELLRLDGNANIFQSHRSLLGYFLNGSWPEIPPVTETWNTEVEIEAADGSRKWILSRGEVVFDDAGEATRFVGALTDISAQKQAISDLRAMADTLAERVRERTAELLHANKELEQASQAKDAFLANMSHELRTPLNAVLGICEAAMEGVYGSLQEAQLNALSIIDESGRHLLQLINDVLDLAKIGAGRLEMDIAAISMCDLFESASAVITPIADKQGLQIVFRLEQADLQLTSDGRRLRQILLNLLSNAAKFTPAGGRIEVGASQVGEDVQIWVEDTGIGIPEDLQDLIFEPFRQVDNSLARRFEGTGLGLALVTQLVAALRGDITVKSKVGEGARFTLTFPNTTDSR